MKSENQEEPNTTNKTIEPDWKAIAHSLAKRVIQALDHLKAPGSGLLYDASTGKVVHWRQSFADDLEKIPGITVDREAMYYSEMSAKEKKEFNKKKGEAK